ncbi:MAG: hypothetical protein KA923_00500, partial [Opitutaceae bacterium]|nr:hypothetical protein [Opitutaceae bacterium]
VTERIAASLGWLSEHGFRYFKSLQHYRKSNPNGFSYIHLNTVTHNRTAYHLAFYLGVQITEVEKAILEIRGESRKLTHYDRTIWNYTVNIGPESSNWKYPTAGTWTGLAPEDFESAAPEISKFISELGLPYVTENAEPRELRRRLIEEPRHATHLFPYRSILAIDALYGTEAQLSEDIALLDQRYAKYAPNPRKDFDQFVEAVREYKKKKSA